MSSTNSKIPVRKNLIPTSYTAAMVGHPNAGKVRMGWVKTNPATASTIKKISAASTNLTKIPIRTKKVAGTSVNTVKESLKADKPSTSKAVELTTPRHGKSADAVVEKTTPCNKTIPSPFIETAPNFNVKDKKSPLQRIVTFYDGMPVVTDYFRLGPLYHEVSSSILPARRLSMSKSKHQIANKA